jgi:hypothetical protein
VPRLGTVTSHYRSAITGGAATAGEATDCSGTQAQYNDQYPGVSVTHQAVVIAIAATTRQRPNHQVNRDEQK